MLYGQYSRGYRSSALNGNAGCASELNVAKPEFLNAFELGLKSQWLDRRVTFNTRVVLLRFLQSAVSAPDLGCEPVPGLRQPDRHGADQCGEGAHLRYRGGNARAGDAGLHRDGRASARSIRKYKRPRAGRLRQRRLASTCPAIICSEAPPLLPPTWPSTIRFHSSASRSACMRMPTGPASSTSRPSTTRRPTTATYRLRTGSRTREFPSAATDGKYDFGIWGKNLNDNEAHALSRRIRRRSASASRRFPTRGATARISAGTSDRAGEEKPMTFTSSFSASVPLRSSPGTYGSLSNCPRWR